MQQENTGNAKGSQNEIHGGTAYIAETIRICNNYAPESGKSIPFQAKALPNPYVERPLECQVVKDKLIRDAPATGTLVVSAIYGLGGIGKSVIASALAHDPDVQQFLPDGVLWATLGQNPDLLPFLFNWIYALGDKNYKSTSTDAASAHLRTLLYDKKMLLVVDDAWSPEHIEPFRVGGMGCRVLVTTREAYVRGAQRHDMDVMPSGQALDLLLKKAQDENPTPKNKEYAQSLVKEMGCLPLALELAGAQIFDGMTWEELLSDFRKEIARLEALDLTSSGKVEDEKTRKQMSLKASFNLSLKLLTSDQLQQFAWLGILPEDVSIQVEMAATLWQVKKRQAGEILRTFRSKALLLSGINRQDQQPKFRVHDLMHDLARNLLVGKGDDLIKGLNLPFAEAHQIFLGYYRTKTQKGRWHTLPNDEYIHAHLAWHMQQARKPDLIHYLLEETTPEGKNGWYEVCDLLGQPAIFVTDLSRAWDLAKKLYLDDALKSVDLQVRYALIFASLNSLIGNIPAELMAVLVAKGQWSPAQALAYAQQANNLMHRSRIIQELAIHLPSQLLPTALDLAREIQNESERAKILRALAPHLREELWSDVLELARGIWSESERANILVVLASHLPEELRSEALRVVRGIQDKSERTKVLSALAPYPSEGLWSEVLGLVRATQPDYERADFLVVLAPHLPEELSSEVLELARKICPESERAKVFSVLAPYLSEELWGEALRLARRTQSESERTKVLSVLAPHLSGRLLNKALRLARGIRSEPERAKVLVALAPCLPKIMDEALGLARRLWSESERAKVLVGLVPRLPRIMGEVLELARVTCPECERTKVLVALAPYLSGGLCLTHNS